jgi:sugar phosphate isomerase/epimerase
MTRRTLVGALAVATAARGQGQTKEWKPKLGVLGPFTEANVAFARQEGFTNMILGAEPRSPLDAGTMTDEKIERVKAALAGNQMHVSALQLAQNHISADPAQRATENGYFVKAIEMAGSPYVGLQYDPSHLVWQMMDPIQAARDFIDKIYDVHLKDTEIRWDILRRCGINPVNGARWWNYRLPGLGSIQWSEFFSVLQRAGYSGAMSIEHEDNLYGADHPGPEFTDDFKTGFRMAHRYLRQYVPD